MRKGKGVGMGRIIVGRIAMMAMTTSSSIRVKAAATVPRLNGSFRGKVRNFDYKGENGVRQAFEIFVDRKSVV